MFKPASRSIGHIAIGRKLCSIARGRRRNRRVDQTRRAHTLDSRSGDSSQPALFPALSPGLRRDALIGFVIPAK